MHHISIKQYKASITVEASLSFSLMLFVLFLMLGPLFILKSSKELILTIDNQSKLMSYYQMLKQNINDLDTDINKLADDKINDIIYVNENETKDKNTFSNVIFESLINLSNYEILFVNIKNVLNPYKSINNIHDNLSLILPQNIDVFDENSKIIKYDLLAFFNLPFNLFHLKDVDQRFVSYRRAFVGVEGDRFGETESSDDSNIVYIANNHVNSHIYHVDRYCTYLEKKTTQIIFGNLSSNKNYQNENYTPCDYCLKNIIISNDSKLYITKYGDKYHYLENCPKMTAIVTNISLDKAVERGLNACSKCKSNDDID